MQPQAFRLVGAIAVPSLLAIASVAAPRAASAASTPTLTLNPSSGS